jgi:hypothetical protein
MRVSLPVLRTAVCSVVLALPLAQCSGASGGLGAGNLGSSAGAPVVPAQARRAAAAASSPQTMHRLSDLTLQAHAGAQAAAIKTGSSNPVSGAPPVPHPNESPCVVTLFSGDEFENFSGQPFAYTPSCPGPWAKVVLHANFSVTAGIQYDRTGSIWLGPVNLFFGTTAEPSPNFSPQWKIEKDETDLSSIFTTAGSGQVILGNLVNSTYTGVISGTAQLYFYPATTEYPAPRTPDQVVAFSAGPTGGTVALGAPSDTLSVSTTFPQNVQSAYLDLYLQSQNEDEFWYSCFPNNLAEELDNCGSTAFREGEVTIDGNPAGVAPVFPWVFTGGIDPFLWIPIVGVQTLNFAPYRVDLTPFAGLLDNGAQHTIAISVFNADNYFSVTGSLLLYLDHDAKSLSGAVTADDISPEPNASVQENVSIDASGNAKGTIGTTATHPVHIAGYLDTPQGRIVSTVDDNVRFSNQQSILATSTRYVQNIQQTTSVEQQTTTLSPAGQQVTSQTYSWPFTLDYSVAVASSGAETQNTTVSQTYQLVGLNQGGAADPGLLLGYLLNTVQTKDQLVVSPSGSLLSAQGSSKAQYELTGNGLCYNEVLASIEYVLTSAQQEGCQ